MKQTHTIPNGKEIPLEVYEPINNGEAVNNIPLKDMSPSLGSETFTREDYLHMRKIDMERENLNRFELRFDPISKREQLGGIKYQIIDGKKSDVPLVDEMGEVLRYPSKFFVTGTGSGFTYEADLTKEIYDALEVGYSYILKGRIANVKRYGEEVFTIYPMSCSFQALKLFQQALE